MKKLAIGAAALWLAGAAGGWAAESALDNIRISRDGAGPSHLFWLAGPSELLPDKDVVGIVDPLLAAIRLYTVRRSKDPIKQRLELIGACALPVKFRPWRILHLKDEVQIEGMPQPGSNGHNAKQPDFQSPLYSVKRTLVASDTRERLEDAGKVIDTKSWNPADSKATIQCGIAAEAAAPVGRTAPFNAVRVPGRENRTITLTNTAAALTDTRPLTVRARIGGKFYLFSIKELEPAPPMRVVQITEGVPTKDGMIRLNQRLLLFQQDGSTPVGEMSFDDIHFRSKIGQKPIAVLPTGEVLAMGKQTTSGPLEDRFRIQSCGFVPKIQSAAKNKIQSTDKEPLCSNESETAVAERQDSDPQAGNDEAAPGKKEKDEKGSGTGEDANSTFKRVSDLAVFPWEADTKKLPPDCRTAAGCEVQGQNFRFVPLKGIRLTHGKYTQNGLPYAQTETFVGFDRFFEGFGQNRLDKKPSGPNLFADALQNVETMQKFLPGNLADHFKGDVGIDCSALVQLAWKGRDGDDRTRAVDIQNDEKMSYRCPHRLPDPSYLRSGDAIGISVKNAGEHIVLYAANIPFDGASESWLVLESSSSCDGVCWSVYDPSFFNGWGLYRAQNRIDKKCRAPAKETSIAGNPFPAELDAWRKKVVQGLPGRK